jgi:hypothetical protein
VTSKQASDRRNSKRFALKDDVYLVFRPGFERLGRIKDISKGGIAVEFPVYDPYEKTATVEVDIIVPTRSWNLKSLACKVVYDVKMDRPTLSGFETRRCGLKFEQPISDEHKTTLRQLLNGYTSHVLPSEYAIRESQASRPS